MKIAVNEHSVSIYLTRYLLNKARLRLIPRGGICDPKLCQARAPVLLVILFLIFCNFIRIGKKLEIKNQNNTNMINMTNINEL